MKYLLLSTCILLVHESYANSDANLSDERSQEIAAVFPLPSTKSLYPEDSPKPEGKSAVKEANRENTNSSSDEKSPEIAAVFPLPSAKSLYPEDSSTPESQSVAKEANRESSNSSNHERSKEIAAVFPLPSSKSLYPEDSSKSTAKKTKEDPTKTARARNLDLALRVAYFRPDDSRFRKIYHDGWADFQIEAAWRQWSVCAPWANFSYYQQGGHSTCQHHYSQAISAMFTTGAKKFFCEKSRWNPYLGAGIGFDYKHFHDRAYYVHKNISRWSPVLIAKSGLQVKLPYHMFFDFFLDYAYIPVFAKHCKHGIHQRGFNSGGLFVGAGFGAKF